MWECVYVIAADCGLVKVGCSGDPIGRMKAMQKHGEWRGPLRAQYWVPSEKKYRFLSLVHAEDFPSGGAYDVEHLTHFYLHKYRAKELAKEIGFQSPTEWFACHPITAVMAAKRASAVFKVQGLGVARVRVAHAWGGIIYVDPILKDDAFLPTVAELNTKLAEGAAA